MFAPHLYQADNSATLSKLLLRISHAPATLLCFKEVLVIAWSFEHARQAATIELYRQPWWAFSLFFFIINISV